MKSRLIHLCTDTCFQAVQDEMINMGPENKLGPLIGWKIGATNTAIQKKLGFGPFFGPLFQSSICDRNSKISLRSLGSVFKAVEAEFAIYIKEDMPALPNGHLYTMEDVWSKVAGIAPSIELAASRIQVPPCAPLTEPYCCRLCVQWMCNIG